jgi:pimeloyl-ACP methyl ester carboxylesterase
VSWARNDECELWYETFGERSDPALLMVNGLGSQSSNYQDAWCEMFADEGLYVIRFDNRDVGLSTSFAGAPTGEAGNAYVITDMAADAVAVLDAEGIDRAHVMGLSMGGMIVQTMAIEHPNRLLSMTSVMSATGEPEFGQSAPEAFAQLTAPPATDRESHVQRWIDGLRVWGSPEFFDVDRLRVDAERSFDRAFTPDGTTRQFMAIRASSPRSDLLREVAVPALVMHGTADTLITPSGGQRTADLIRGARFVLIEGMGHDYPPQLWRRWVDEVTGFIRSL